MQTDQEFDFFVIGGGSGGLAAAQRAGNLGAKVGLADFVKPSIQGTKWGLGGTCVNVGCIPKKMMHFAGQLGELRHQQIEAGWAVEMKNHDWDQMVGTVQMHIKSLNFLYRNQLTRTNVKYFNKLATVLEDKTIQLTGHNGEHEYVRAKNILIAVGGRPINLENVPKELTITSDDIFSLKKPPGKTLIVGASYVALECGGFLNGLGFDTTIMVRSILLRGFDQEVAEKIGVDMALRGCKFIRGCVPDAIELTQEGLKLVKWKLNDQVFSDTFDSVLVAIGRYPDTSCINIVNKSKSGKIICNDADQTSTEGIYAIGDCVEGRPELTPTAIKCGQMLADRLFGGKTALMNYDYVATTVFTPLEYGCVGVSEENAPVNSIIYHSIFKPLEWNFSETESRCFIKMIVDENRRIVGLHYLGPNAGEVIQGYAVALKLGITKEQFDETVGIHPTCSEELLSLTAVKGIDEPEKEGC